MAPGKPDRGESSEPTFEDRLSRLEELVRELESGELSLEQGVERYREGVELLKVLQSALGAAEQQVLQLTEVLRQGLAELEAREIPAREDEDR